MTHGRKPRSRRHVAQNPIGLAKDYATKLTRSELDQVMDPLRDAVAALRRGVATEFEWMVAVTAVNIADAIESQRVVRGLAGHIKEIDRALEGIRARAMSSGAWRAPALYYEERDSMDLLVDLHGYQLSNLSFGEFGRARDKAIAQTACAGGRVVHEIGEPDRGAYA
ncbi:MAG: hypothetical protein J7605_02690 [Variovorax sp.]|nr:hypothetical protein [Variovorax sp.]